MTNPKDTRLADAIKQAKELMLADAIEQAIESSRRVIRLKRLALLLSVSNILFIIAFFVELLCD